MNTQEEEEWRKEEWQERGNRKTAPSSPKTDR